MGKVEGAICPMDRQENPALSLRGGEEAMGRMIAVGFVRQLKSVSPTGNAWGLPTCASTPTRRGDGVAELLSGE